VERDQLAETVGDTGAKNSGPSTRILELKTFLFTPFKPGQIFPLTLSALPF